MSHKIIEILDYLTIEQVNYTFGMSGVFVRVCHHDYCSSVRVQFVKNRHYFGSVGRIKITGRLVGQDKSRP